MADERRVTHRHGGQVHVRRADGDDEAIAQLASEQHGIVGRRQLLEIGVSARTIDRRLANGRLRKVHRGAYAAGHDALTYAGRVFAAVIALHHPGAGLPAVGSHLTAAALRDLCDPPAGPVHLTTSGFRHPRPGLAIHRALLPPDEVEVVNGIPMTTLPRTLLDLSATGNEGKLRRLFKEAEFHELVDVVRLEAILDRYPRRRGRGMLAGIVERYRPVGKTRSEIEDLFLELCVERGIPLPETNVVLRIRGRQLEVDCLWRNAGLIVELDGRQAHGTDSGFEEDRARDRLLIASGLVPMRVTWAQLRYDRDALDAEIRDALAARVGHERRLTHRSGG